MTGRAARRCGAVLDSLSAEIGFRILEQAAGARLHDGQQPADVEVAVKLLGFALAQRPGPRFGREFVDAFLAARKGKKRAIVAVAHALLTQ